MKNYNDTLLDFLEDYYKIHGYPPLPFEIDSESDLEEVEDD